MGAWATAVGRVTAVVGGAVTAGAVAGGAVALSSFLLAPSLADEPRASHPLGVVVVEAAPPTELSIPSIDVLSPLVGLGRKADGTVEVPEDAQQAGWYADGARPGQVGGAPAVIAGLADSADGPAVFHRLHELEVGSKIKVRGTDDVVRTFTVYRMADYESGEFPADEVYAPTEGAELRLITNSEDSDDGADTLVAFAALV